jgi:hypothetical protein
MAEAVSTAASTASGLPVLCSFNDDRFDLRPGVGIDFRFGRLCLPAKLSFNGFHCPLSAAVTVRLAIIMFSRSNFHSSAVNSICQALLPADTVAPCEDPRCAYFEEPKCDRPSAP